MIFAGLLLQPPVLRRLLGGHAPTEMSARTAALAGGVIAAWGLFNLLLGRRQPLARHVNLAMVGWFILAPLFAEAALRIAIGLGLPQARNIDLYAAYSYDDDYWLLQNRWLRTYKPVPPRRVHPLRGWSQDVVTPQNPLGLQQDSLWRLLRAERRMVLFYGDSFVKGDADVPFELPRYLDARLGDVDVVDLGVGGYGMDQVFLLFRETYDRVPRPLVVVGVYLEDLDRAALSVRTSQKPFFRIEKNGSLFLFGLPIARDQHGYFASRSLSFHSYFLQAVTRTVWAGVVRRQQAEADVSKRALARRLVLETKKMCDGRQVPLLYVLFYHWDELGRTTWREAFLRSTLAELGVPYVDTKPVLKAYAESHAVDVRTLYVTDGLMTGHHNNLGNQVIGDALLKELRGRLGDELEPRRLRPPPQAGGATGP